MPSENASPLAFHQHDHSCCAQDVLAYADKSARENGLRLTPVRRHALEVLLENHCAMGAYDVLERLAEGGFGNQPPVAYRALDFLVENGLAHRVRRLNAYTACMHPETEHAPLFMICRECAAVAESVAPNVHDEIATAAAGANFLVERTNVEILGLCPTCQDPA